MRGQLCDDVSAGLAIAAAFPTGTITAGPGTCCIEIVARIENGPRRVCPTSFGDIYHDGSLDLNILIRTMVKQRSKLTLRAGAGIMADSDAAVELEETRAEVKGMLRALGQGDSK